MDRKTIDSTLIRSVGYDSVTQTLEIEFQPSPKQKKAWEADTTRGKWHCTEPGCTNWGAWNPSGLSPCCSAPLQKEVAPGPVFQYGPCSPATHTELIGKNKYHSAGRYFLKAIKPVFDGRKLNAQTETEDPEPPAPKAA
jgi:hypothetical protein